MKIPKYPQIIINKKGKHHSEKHKNIKNIQGIKQQGKINLSENMSTNFVNQYTICTQYHNRGGGDNCSRENPGNE